VIWNVAAQRYYLSCYDLSGNRIYTVAVVETPRSIMIDRLTWDVNTLTVKAELPVPHNFTLGWEILLLIEGADQPLYNGSFLCLADGPNTFSYFVGSDPGNAQQFGSVSQIINLGGGYFNSSLIFRNNAFEVRP
jgi:hypothetical protein